MSNNKPRSNRPYDPNNSFVKKVASRVSGLIPKSTSWLSTSISGWFAPTTNPDQGSTNREQVNDEEEHFEDALEKPPPSKRFKLSSNQQYVDTYSRCQNIEEGEGSSRLVPNNFIDTSAIPGPSGLGGRSSGFVASTPAVTSVGHLETKANGDDCSESGESTSGCSSLEPQINRGVPNTQNQSRQNDSLSPRRRLLDDKLNYSYLQSSRSLYLDRSANSRSNQTVGRRNNPSFCVNTFGAPLFGERGSVNDLILNSPFYSGRTTYGGASSASYRRSLGSASLSSSPANSEKRHAIKVKPGSAQPTEDSSMSQTAKRILATLEQFSTPILDAKRIPVAQEPVLASLGSRKRSRADDVNNTQLVLEQPNVPKRISSKPMHWAKGAPSTSQLTFSVTPDTLILKRREIAQEPAALAAKPAQSSTTETYTLRTETDGGNSSRNNLKMRPRITDEDKKDPEMPTEVKLPEVALPISKLPTFDISVPAPKPVVNKSLPMTASSFGSSTLSKPLPTNKIPAPVSSNISVPLTKLGSEAVTSESSPFSFSSPIRVSSASKDQPLTPINNFTFSKPLPASMNFSEPSSNCVKARPKANPDSPKQSDGFSGGPKPASALRTGSVMDILGKGSDDTTKNASPSANGSFSLMDKFKPAAGTWECDKCLIRNKSDVAKCVACTNPRETKSQSISNKVASEMKPAATTSSASTAVAKTESGFGAQFKMAQGLWECSACMVRNKEADTKCVSCTTPKPGSEPVKSAPAPAASFSGWGDKFKPPSNTWECSVCMVRNSSELLACQSCTTKKAEPSGASVPPVKSSWGDLLKKPEGSWTCNECMVTNKATDLKCLACTTPKPGSEGTQTNSSEAPKFSFGIPASSDGGSSAPAFSFGIPKDSKETTDKEKSSVSSSTGFKFGENKSEVPAASFSFGVPPSAASVPATSSNTATTGSSVFSASPAISSPSASAAKQLSSPATAQSALPTPNAQPAFSFGVPASSDVKTATSPMFSSFSKPAVSAVTSQPASSSGSPLGGKRKFGDDAPSSSAVPIKFGVASNETNSVSLANPHPLGTSASSVSSTSGQVFSYAASSSTTSANSASPFLSTSVTSTANGQSNLEAAKTAPANSIFSSLVSSPSSSAAPKPAVTFGLGAGAAKDESVSSTWKAQGSVASSDDPKPGQDLNGAAKPFGFGSNVSSSGMAFGSNSSSSSATFSFGSSDKTNTAGKPALTFGSPASSGGLFGSGAGKSTTNVPSFGTPNNSGFGTLTSPSNPSHSFQLSNVPAPTLGSSPVPAPTFSGFGQPEEKKVAFSAGPSEPKKAGFAFSAPSDEKKPFTFGSSDDAKKPTFSFNATPATTAPTQNSFQASSVFTFGSAASAPTPVASNGPAKPNFSFGASQAPSFSSFNPQPTSSTAGFNFGAPAAAPSFGAVNNTAAPAPSPFDGGSTTNAFAPSAGFGFGAPSPAPPAFNFSAPTSTPGFGTQNPSGFAFNSEAKPSFAFTSGPSMGFSATPDGSQTPQTRVIRKAARRKR